MKFISDYLNSGSLVNNKALTEMSNHNMVCKNKSWIKETIAYL